MSTTNPDTKMEDPRSERVENRRQLVELEEIKLSKIQLENENIRLKMQQDKSCYENELKMKELEIELLRLKVQVQGSTNKSSISKFDERSDSIDSYITRFEKSMKRQGIEDDWSWKLMELMTGKALDMCKNIEDNIPFHELKERLLAGFGKNAENYRTEFRNRRWKSSEPFSDWARVLQENCRSWMEALHISTMDGLMNVMIREQILQQCDPDLRLFLRQQEEGGTVQNLCEKAEIFLQAKPKRSTMTCFKCGVSGHLANKCSSEKPQHTRIGPTCTKCNSGEHYADRCPGFPNSSH